MRWFLTHRILFPCGEDGEGAAQGPGGILACGSWKGEGWDVDVGKSTLEYA